jgi:hypothetical protein
MDGTGTRVVYISVASESVVQNLLDLPPQISMVINTRPYPKGHVRSAIYFNASAQLSCLG